MIQNQDDTTGPIQPLPQALKDLVKEIPKGTVKAFHVGSQEELEHVKGLLETKRLNILKTPTEEDIKRYADENPSI